MCTRVAFSTHPHQHLHYCPSFWLYVINFARGTSILKNALYPHAISKSSSSANILCIIPIVTFPPIPPFSSTGLCFHPHAPTEPSSLKAPRAFQQGGLSPGQCSAWVQTFLSQLLSWALSTRKEGQDPCWMGFLGNKNGSSRTCFIIRCPPDVL